MERKSLLKIIHELNRFVNKPLITHNGVAPISEEDLLNEIKVLADKCLDKEDDLSQPVWDLLDSLNCGPRVPSERRIGLHEVNTKTKNKTVQTMWPPKDDEWHRFSKEFPTNIKKLKWNGETMEHNEEDLEIKVVKTGTGNKHIDIKEFITWVLDNLERDRYYTYSEIADMYCVGRNVSNYYVKNLAKRVGFWGKYWREDFESDKTQVRVKKS